MTNPVSEIIDFIHRHRPVRPGRYVMPYLTVAITALLIFNLVEVSQTAHFAGDLRDGLVKSCEENGNPLREAVQDQIQRQIEQRETLDYKRFFPSVPPGELERLLDEQTAEDEATLARIAPVNCPSLFP